MATRQTTAPSSERITVDALRYYVPLFQVGDAAQTRLMEECESLTASEKNLLNSKVILRQLAIDRIAALASPLITKELNKIIRSSHVAATDYLFDVLYYAGINGMVKGLRHFDVSKNKSPTNYIFMWITTYARKELSSIESSQFGIAPSRFEKYKKISAVRKKLTEELGRYAENGEVHDFFQSGRADIKTMSGRMKKSGKPFESNLAITMDLIKEQEDFERNMKTTKVIDPSVSYSDSSLSIASEEIFDETMMGAFIRSYNFTDKAVAVMMSELARQDIPESFERLLQEIEQTEYRAIVRKWREMMKDKNGPFFTFLLESGNDYVGQIDVKGTLASMSRLSIQAKRYLPLFRGETIRSSSL